MLFNSLEFAFFLPIVFVLYWFILNRNLRLQNFFLLAASYFFYGWWDWRFLGLIFFSSSIDYAVGLLISNTADSRKRKSYLVATLTVNLVILGFFKYFNFFAQSFQALLAVFGIEASFTSLNIILPVGISFYTFQSMGYAIDVYRKDIEASKDTISFLAFVSFFPHMVAGPIMRAKKLLPQFYKSRIFNYEYAVSGLQFLLLGFFKKVVIADNAAKLADTVFNNPSGHSGWSAAAGVIFFTVQIYCDFSGYSDMAVGIARLLGFDLMQNFRTPYFSLSIRAFWQRWHIALSTWFKDYVYIPLGGNRVGEAKRYVNLFVTFLISGLWHGANYTFLVWGAMHGIFMIVEDLISAHSKLKLPNFFRWLITFCLVSFAWIFFRAKSVNDAAELIGNLFNPGSLVAFKDLLLAVYASHQFVLILAACMILLFIIELQLSCITPDVWMTKLPKPLRISLYYLLLFLIVFMGLSDLSPNFIYFNF
ncbi:MAG: MBOAT family protein [Bacteroidetes bacterium]|nr:MBOAT family protein [Bacteroidota bacterium]